MTNLCLTFSFGGIILERSEHVKVKARSRLRRKCVEN